jgi:uncharacterized membrane protein YdjX (TVP38/TMEM64 family)
MSGVLAVAAIAIVVLHSGRIAEAVVDAARQARDAGAWGIALFALVSIAGTAVFVPQLALTIPAGFSYGLTLGFAIAMVTSFAASVVAFLLGRSLLRERVERRFRCDRRMARLDQAVRERGLVVVMLLRLAPMVPFAPVNYMMSITSVTARQYVLGTALGLAPTTLLMVYIGSIAPDAVAILRGGDGAVWELVVQLVIGLAITGVLAHLARRALRA